MKYESNKVGIALSLSKATNRALSISATKSGRSKKQEAAIRLADHLQRFKVLNVPFALPSDGIGIGFDMSAEINKLLTIAAGNSNRAKRDEAALRIEDHLNKFESIAEVGEVKERETEQ